MRPWKAVLAAVFALFAVIAGIFAAVVLAITGAAVLLVRRLFRSLGSSQPQPQLRPRPRPAQAQDAIDVTATEVPAEPPPRIN